MFSSFKPGKQQFKKIGVLYHINNTNSWSKHK